MIRRANRRERITAGMLLAVATACIGSLTLAGCTSPTTPLPATASSSSSSSSSSSPNDGDMSAKTAITKIMATGVGAKAIASAHGTIEAVGPASSVVADILKVERLTDSTVLTWRLKSATGAAVATNSFQLSKPPFLDTRYVGLIDRSTKRTYYAYTYVPAKQGNGADVSCLCAGIPDEVGASGTVLQTILPPLPASVTSVDVTIPGFDAIKNVTVSRG